MDHVCNFLSLSLLPADQKILKIKKSVTELIEKSVSQKSKIK